MKNTVLIKIILVLFLLQSCAPKSKITINPIDEKIQIDSQKAIEYDNFWAAMENIDFDYLENHKVGIEQQSFAEALKLLIHGNIGDSADEFKKLYVSSSDSLIRKYSKGILGNLLLFQSKWEDLSELYSEADNIGILANAFINSPKEHYYFPSKSTFVPIKLSKTGSPVITVKINGQKKNFWVDTGAGLSVISSDVAKISNVKPIESEKATAGTGTSKKIIVQPAVIESLKIGDLLIKNHPVIIIDKNDLEFKLFGLFRIMKIDGIIGWNALQNMDVEIDYIEKNVSIKEPVNRDIQTRNFFWLGYPTVMIRNQQGVKLNFGIDTGAYQSSIRDNIFNKINVDSHRIKKKTIGSAGGSEKADSKLVSDFGFILSDYEVNFKDIGTHPENIGRFVQLDGILGGDVFTKGLIKIDISNGIFEFKSCEEN